MSSLDALEAPAKAMFASAFDGVLRIECTDDGSSIWIDGRSAVPSVGPQAPPDVSGRFCLWRADFQTLHGVLTKQRKLESVYVAGNLKISGDMAVMARLDIGEVV